MKACNTCGGSGVKRVSSQRFKTCFACLGQGKESVIKISKKNRKEEEVYFLIASSRTRSVVKI